VPFFSKLGPEQEKLRDFASRAILVKGGPGMQVNFSAYWVQSCSAGGIKPILFTTITLMRHHLLQQLRTTLGQPPEAAAGVKVTTADLLPMSTMYLRKT